MRYYLDTLYTLDEASDTYTKEYIVVDVMGNKTLRTYGGTEDGKRAAMALVNELNSHYPVKE